MSDKWLYSFTVKKTEEIYTEEKSKNDKGEETTTKKKEVKESDIVLKIKKPNRRLYDEADLFYGVKLSEGIKAGLLTKTLLAKRYENDGGPMSNPEKEEYANLYMQLYDQENLVQKIQLNLEKMPEEERREKLKEAIIQMSSLKQELHRFEMSQQSLFDQTAEVRARNQAIMWWVLNLAHIEDGDKVLQFFEGSNYEQKLEDYDRMEEEENPFWAEAIKKFIYFVSFWEAGQISSKEDFEGAERVFNQSIEEQGKDEEEVEEIDEKEIDDIADELLALDENKEETKGKSKSTPKATRKPKKKDPEVANV